MPLKLIEPVLPWLVASLKEDEAQSFLLNMHMAGNFDTPYPLPGINNFPVYSFLILQFVSVL